MNALKDHKGKQSSVRWILIGMLLYLMLSTAFTQMTLPVPEGEWKALPDIGEGWVAIIIALVAKIGSEAFAKNGNGSSSSSTTNLP